MSFLDDLKKTAQTAASSVIQSAADTVTSSLGGTATPVSSPNKAPAPSIPDLAARAQTQASSFFSSSVGGVGVPILLAIAAGIYLLKRK